MTYTSTIPAALANFAAMLALALPDVEVTDGPPTGNPGIREAITVGYSPSEDVDAAEVTSVSGDLATTRDRETYTIHCSLEVLNGDRDMVAARARAYELFGAVGAVLAADQTLRGAVMTAGLSAHSLRQSDADSGSLARINFSVDVDAFTGR